MTSTTLSVNSSQPLPEWEPASLAFTVRHVLRSRTPFCAHAVRFLSQICQITTEGMMLGTAIIHVPMLRHAEFRVFILNFLVDLPTTSNSQTAFKP